jgi:hypothetical protein
MLLNLSGALKVFPVAILIICFLIELCTFKLSRRGLAIAVSIFLLIAYKLMYGFNFSNLDATTTAFEGISIAFLLFVTPFFRAELMLINKHRWPVVADVLTLTYFVLLLDLIIRIYIHGIWQFFNLTEYTIAKELGLFPTSNISGGLAFVLFCYSLNTKGFYSWRSFTALILLFGSLSRVSIFATFLVIAHHIYFIEPRHFLKFSLRSFLVLLAIILFSPVHDYFMSDGSFISKIDLISSGVTKFVGLTDFEILLLGFPLDSFLVADFLDVEGWSPHLSFLKAFLYYGLLGIILWMFSHYYIWQKSHLKTVVVGGLVMGLAGLPILWPPLLLTLFEYKNMNKSFC